MGSTEYLDWDLVSSTLKWDTWARSTIQKREMTLPKSFFPEQELEHIIHLSQLEDTYLGIFQNRIRKSNAWSSGAKVIR